MSILVITVDLVLGSNTPQLAAICHSGESRNPEVILDAGSSTLRSIATAPVLRSKATAEDGEDGSPA